jgi:C4-dicarboxylate-specific signal transduction histidine kinase
LKNGGVLLKYDEESTMKLVLKRIKAMIDAKGEYNPETKTFIVKKGSTVSVTVAHTDKFRRADSIERYRAQYVKNRVVTEDVVFRSASTAANFVTGSSTNGLIAWKSPNGDRLKDILNS